MLPRSLNYLSFPLRPKRKKKEKKERDSQDTVTPSDIINKQKPHKETKQPAKQPASQPATILTGCWKRHTQREQRLMLIFDQQVSSTKRNTSSTNAHHAYSPLCWCRGIVNGKRRREREWGKAKKCIGDERFGVVHGEMHALGQVGRCNVFVLKGKPCAIRRRNIALLAVGSFTTGSSRFASYVTNGLSGVGKERGICWMREREKSSTALNSHGNLHLG